MKFLDKPCCHLNCIHRSVCFIHENIRNFKHSNYLGTPRKINEAIAKLCCKFNRELTEEERANVACGRVYSE